LLSVSVDALSKPLARREQRPYLLWLERSRDRWKERAVGAASSVITPRKENELPP